MLGISPGTLQAIAAITNQNAIAVDVSQVTNQ